MICRLIHRAKKIQPKYFSTKGSREQTLDGLTQQGVYKQVSSEAIRTDRFSMTPHQYWIAKGRGMERPFTGEYWFNQEVGDYQCRVCKNKLFSFENKMKSETGMASFWNHQINSLSLMEPSPSETDAQGRHVCCAECKSHVGKVYFDGPPPTFIRYEINSAALHFDLKQFFEDPSDILERKNEQKLQKKAAQKRNFLKEHQILADDIDKK